MMPATLFHNGTILTLDDDDTTPEAVVIEGELIVAVGDFTALRRAHPDALEYDLGGGTMIPAFIDAHGHFPDSAIVDRLRVDVSVPPRGDCQTLTDVFAKLREKVLTTPTGQWIMGAAFDESGLSEGRMPSRGELDALSTDHPIWVLHSSGHCGVANSAALAARGINEDTPDPPGGRFIRCDAGHLTGEIRGLSAMGALADTHFLVDKDSFATCFAADRQDYLQHGVTLAQNSWTARPLLDLFADHAAQPDPGIDLILLPVTEEEPEFSSSQYYRDWPGKHIALGPRKILTDGSFLMRSAYLTSPYHTGANGAEPDCGLSYLDAETTTSEVCKLHEAGHQIHVHCNGDAAADMFLGAVETALSEHPRDDHRHTLIHGQVMRRDQMARCAELGVTISFFSAHVYYWGDMHHEVLLGPERAANISPAVWAQEAGVRFTIHNDAAVTPTRPLHLIHTAVNRQTMRGRTLGAHQRITPLAALRAHTIDAAWQVFREYERGSIEIGKLAELVVLDRNPIDHSERIDEIKVSETWRRGKLV